MTERTGSQNTISKLYNWSVSFSKLASEKEIRNALSKIPKQERSILAQWCLTSTIQAFSDELPEGMSITHSRPLSSASLNMDITPKNLLPPLPTKTVDTETEPETEPEAETQSKPKSTIPRKRKIFDPSDNTATIKLLTANADSQPFDIPSNSSSVVPATKTELYTSIKNYLAKISNSVHDNNQVRYAIADNLMKLSELHHGKLKDDGTTTTSKKFLDLIAEKFKINQR